jgi:hypothetical protein
MALSLMWNDDWGAKNTFGKAGQGTDYTKSVWGSTIPISAGFRKLAGVPVWSGAPYVAEIRSQYMPAPPGLNTQGYAIFKNQTYTTWHMRRNFMVSLGRRLNPDEPAPMIRRIWWTGTSLSPTA